jgi:hypothetical protein
VLLAGLRNARTPREAATLLRVAEEAHASEDVPTAGNGQEVLALLEVHGDADVARRLARVIEEALRRPLWLSANYREFFQLLRRISGASAATGHFLLLAVEERDVKVLQVLVEEHSRLLPDDVFHLHVLREVSRPGNS